MTRIRRGAFVEVPPVSDEVEHILRARAALDVRPAAVLSHITAALLHGLAVSRHQLRWVHLTAPTRRGRRFGVHTHGSALDPREVRSVSGLPVTGTARTLLDCALLLPLDEGVALIDNALNKELLVAEALSASFPMLGHRHGLARAREAVRLADGRAESVGETRARLILLRAGIQVTPQVEIPGPDGRTIARSDLGLDDTSVVIEFDGRAKYSIKGDPEQAHWDEKRRQIAIERAGFTVVRLTWGDLDFPDDFIARVRQAITRSDRR